ncbi:hypothetical protein CEXT_216891 [Caerostris extrusa]|uniref:Uncharacterized protein n=1 Tax=Caerostris extrusa TaxID=172846 RepID=A0AAV4XTQ9_CAEEX|nr:hypothetical protein CEXT_216891 [Caerostris extrusa]
MNYSAELKLITCQSKSGTNEIRSSNDMKSSLRLIERLAHKILLQRQGPFSFLPKSIESPLEFCLRVILLSPHFWGGGFSSRALGLIILSQQLSL